MTDTTPSTDAPAHERHGARAAVYSALAGAFCYPDGESLAELTAPEALTGLAAAGETLGLDSAVRSLCEALEECDPARLRAVHTELFGLPGEEGAYPVVPYEANYTVRDDVGQKQRRIARVAGAVDALGLEFGDAFDERQDHVAVELELMQVIAARRAVAVRQDRDDDPALERVEATLLAEHLVDFVPPLATEIREATDVDLYCAAADLAETLVVRDHERRDRGEPAPSRTDDADRSRASGGGR